ncbi:substrate-binding domain-containing protein [Arthrobacter sp. 2RAF6]|uniref:substrate-binding domain-containing protein n=1 Tax=Arthrobacter sp. 2RAF6 TaxID=3233002 RepID=UPI003F91011C
MDEWTLRFPASGVGGLWRNSVERVLPLLRYVVQDLNDAEAARNAVRALLRSNSPPTAIFASQNLVTIGAMRALRECGLQKSVALVGFDDFSLAGLIEPGVTVVVPDPERMGRIAAEMLFMRIGGSRAEPRTHIVPTELLERGSGELWAAGTM